MERKVKMKVVMVNDCAHVGKTSLKYLPSDVEKQHIQRTRGFWSKTFGIAYSVLKARGDVYHVHYLLQDCYIASKLDKHPLVGHAHGSDLRETIDRFWLGGIVKDNLTNCSKVLVSTPNLLDKAKTYNQDSEYMPNPVDTSLFYPKERKKPEGKLKVLIAAGNNWKIKGTDRILHALKSIEKNVDISLIGYGVDTQRTLKLAKSLSLDLHMLSSVQHAVMPRYYWEADIVIAAIGIDGTLGMVALEAIACGRPVVTRVSSDFSEYHSFPLQDVSTPEDIASAVLSARDDELWEKEYKYVQVHHDPSRVSQRLMKIYDHLVELANND
jgi:glycosyltransferase involved in cell wall biosynthesis